MAKKVLLGMLFVAIGCAIAGAGYEFGRHLAQKDNAALAQEASAP